MKVSAMLYFGLLLLVNSLLSVCFELPESCWQAEQCLGHLLEAKANINREDCVQACADDGACQWVSHNWNDNSCHLNQACYATFNREGTKHASIKCTGTGNQITDLCPNHLVGD